MVKTTLPAPRAPAPRKPGFILAPFTVAVDQQEQAGYMFTGFYADADQGGKQLIVRREVKHLKTGDYSIVGLEHLLTIERKSLGDLYGTLGQGRERFEREHERMREIVNAGGFACVLIESSLANALENPPLESRLEPKTVHRTALSWAIRYKTPWFWVDDRRLAEVTCYRLLEKWWDNYERKLLGLPE